MQKYKVFVQVAESRSMTAAAQALGYTQSGISHQMKAMEEALGLPLLKRTRHGVELTREGTSLLPAVRALLAAEQELHMRAALLRKELGGKLTVGTFSSVMLRWMPDIMKRFSQWYPETGISVANGTYPDVLSFLLSGQIDCGFVTLPADSRLKVWSLKKDQMYAIVHESDQLSAFSELSAQQLEGRTFIVPAEGMDYGIGAFFARSGISPRLYLELKINDDYSALALVKARCGFTIMPELLIETLPMEQLRAIPLRTFQREIAIAVKESAYRTPAVDAFISCTRAAVAQIP